MEAVAPIASPPGGEVGQATTIDGAPLRVARWAQRGATARATVVLLHGRTEFIEKYHEVVDDLLARDYAVLTFDWRGQGLSHRLLTDRRKGHIDRYESYLADLNAVLSAYRDRMPRPYLLLAHSMGGHIALRHLSYGSEIWNAVVLSAPMVDINFGPLGRPLANAISGVGVRLGMDDVALPCGARQAPWTLGREQAARRFARNPLTSDRQRYGHMLAWLAANPDLSVGAATIGWLHASLASARLLARPATARAISAPVLVLSAGDDRVVCNRAQGALVRQLPQGELITLDGSRHEPMMERYPIRDRFWQCLDAFADARL